MNPRLASILAGSVLAAGAAVVAVQESPEVAELETIAAESPEYAPIIKAGCPECDVQIDCWRRADGYLCRHGLLYGPGLGGIYADGTPATCAPGQGDEPWPCTGPSADWPEQSKRLADERDAAKILEVIEARPKRGRAP